MESYGQILREKREEKNISVTTASRETSITREYIEALEAEDSTVFSGEAYLVGFLRNYAEYLDIPPDVVLALYKNKELQEAPVPESLLAKNRSPFLVPLVLGIIVLILGAVGVILWFTVFSKNNDAKDESYDSSTDRSHSYTLSSESLSTRVYRGDQITIPASGGNVVATVKNTITSFGMETPVGVLYTDLAEELELDIDGDAVPDLIVYVSDISMTDEARGAEVRFVLKKDGDMASASSTDLSEIEIINVENGKEPKIILEDTRAYPFTITATFRGSCIFRYRSDNSGSEEHNLLNGDSVNITSNNRLRLWMSNSNAVSFALVADTRRIDLGVGRAGQVLVEDIRWTRTADGIFQLVIIELD